MNPMFKLLIFVAVGYWTYDLTKLIRELPHWRDMNRYYEVLFGVSNEMLCNTPWNLIVDRISSVYNETLVRRTASPKRMNAHDIANRIMRQENYMIALFNKDTLNLSVPFPSWFFGRKQILTKVLEWNLHFCVIDYVFDNTGKNGQMSVKKEFLRDIQRSKLVSGLKQRFLWMALLNLIMAPFSIVFLLVYFLFKYGQEYHKNPTELSARNYSPLAKWKFRDFNELPHYFHARLDRTYEKATRYMNQFPSQKLAIFGKFISFIAGAFGLSLTFLSVFDDNFLLNFNITPGRSVLWYLGLFGAIWSAGRSLIPSRLVLEEPQEILMEIMQDLHFLPHEWRAIGLNSKTVYREFSNLFDYRLVLFAQEVLSIIFTPFVLAFSLPPCATDIIDFFKDFTVHVDSLGYVCSFAVFDFHSFNESRGALEKLPRTDSETSTINAASSSANIEEKIGLENAFDVDQDKMERSVINFKKNFPEWDPPDPESSLYLKKLVSREGSRIKSVQRPKNKLYTRKESPNSRITRPIFNGDGESDVETYENDHTEELNGLQKLLPKRKAAPIKHEEIELQNRGGKFDDENDDYQPPPSIPDF